MDCNCQKEKEIAEISATFKAWRRIIEGNGHDPIEARVLVLEKTEKKMETAIDNLVKITEDVRKTASATAQTVAQGQERKKNNLLTVFNSITLLLMLIGLIYQMFIK